MNILPKEYLQWILLKKNKLRLLTQVADAQPHFFFDF
jgi:hypothetical protein